MTVNKERIEYIDMLPEWVKIRDFKSGSPKVKSKNETYLSKTWGQQDDARWGQQRYDAYKLRAQVPDIVAPTLKGLTGIIHRKPAQYTIPEKMQYLIDDASSDAKSLSGIHRDLTKENLLTGRVGVLVDLPENGDQPYLSVYNAESIINWKETLIDGVKTLEFVVLREDLVFPGPDDFVISGKTHYRLLQWKDGEYLQSLWTMPEDNGDDDADSEPVIVKEPVSPNRLGTKFTEIPFTFINAESVTTDITEPPMLALAELSASIYRTSADHKQSLYLTSQPTAVVAGGGFNENNPLPPIGSQNAWLLDDASAKAWFLEFSGAGIQAMERDIGVNENRAVAVGAQLLETGQAESGEALKTKSRDKTSSLIVIAKTTADGLQRSLKHIAQVMSIDVDKVKVEPNVDFISTQMNPQQITAMVGAWQSGAISQNTMLWNFQRGEILPPGKNIEDEISQIENGTLGLDLTEAEKDGEDSEQNATAA